MKRNQVLWTAAALVVMLGGFLLERAASDDGASTESASVVDVADGRAPDADSADSDPDDSDPDDSDQARSDAAGADAATVDPTIAGSGPGAASIPGTDDDDPASSERGPPVRYSDLPTITLDALPSEALDVLERIEAGGPYAYRQDDSTFQNREGILPARTTGHYREYTVETPGSSDRGARRIVAGADGERYWTDDHYRSFTEIVF